MQKAYAHGGGTLLVDGHSGMGKTYFLRDLAFHARKDNRWRVTFLNADSIERGEPHSFLDRLYAAGISPDWDFDPEAQHRPLVLARQWAREILQAPTDVTEGHIIIVDDAQWIDPESAIVIRHLTPRVTRRNIFIVCGARIPHEPASVGQYLADIAGRNPQEQHITLEPLTEDEILGLAFARFGISIPRRNAAELLRITGGSFLGVDTMLTQVTPDEIRKLHTTWDMPIRKVELQNPLLGSYRKLSDQARPVAQIVCLAGHELSPTTLRAAAYQLGVSPDYAEAIRAGVIMESDFGNSIVPKHALSAAAVQEIVDDGFAKQVHRALSKLSQGFTSVQHMVKGAETWNVELQQRTVRYARKATARRQYTNANGILRMALAVAEDPEARQELITELVLLHTRAKTGYMCLDLLPEIEAFPNSMLREFLAVMVRVYLVEEKFPEQRVQAVLAAKETTPDERALQAFLAFMMIMMMMRSTDRSRILALMPVARALFDAAPGQPEELSDTRLAWMVRPQEFRLLIDAYEIVQWHLNGQMDETRAALPKLLERANELEDRGLKVDCLVPLAGAAMATGDVPLAHEVAGTAVSLLDLVGNDPFAAATPRIILAHSSLLLGKYRQATQVLDELDEVSHDTLDLEARLTGAALRAKIAAITQRGDPEQAWLPAGRTRDLDWEHYGRDLFIMAKAEIARTQGDFQAAEVITSAQQTAAFESTQRGFLTYRAHALTKLGRHDEAQPIVDDLAARRGDTWYEYWGTLEWLQAGIAAANGNNDVAQQLFESALTYKVFPLPWSLTALDYATFLNDREQYQRAAEILGESIAVLEKLEAQAYLAQAQQQLEKTLQQRRASQVSTLATLTERERKVGELLSAGYSNKAIADELVISLSTVRFHVSNILRKLHLTSRAQVPRIFQGSTARNGTGEPLQT